MTTKTPEIAVAASTPVPWAIGGPSEGLVSLGLGLLAVLLARAIFINRENRALGYRQHWKETLPVTLAACLITGGIVVDRHLPFSASIFTGIGVGWSTILVINQISRIVNPADVPKDIEKTEAAKPRILRSLQDAYPLPDAIPLEAQQLLDQIKDKEPPENAPD